MTGRPQPAAPWRERPIGGFPDAAAWAELSGGDVWRRLAQGRLGVPPIVHFFAMQMFAEGGVGASIPASPWLRDVNGEISLGVLAIVADVALFWAMLVEQEPGAFYTTVDIKLDQVEPVRPGPHQLRSRGRLIAQPPGQALTAAELESGGRLVATSASRLALVPARGRAGETDADGELLSDRPVGWTEPVLRPLPDEESRGRNGRLDPAASPLWHLLGFSASGTAAPEVRMPASPWFRPPTPFVQGGVLVLLAEQAMLAAVSRELPAGTRARCVSVTTDFVRPVPADGSELTCAAVVENRSRSLAVASARAFDARGKLAAFSIATIALEPAATRI